MKYIFLLAIIGLQLLFVFKWNFMYSIAPFVWVFSFCLVTGGFIKFSKAINNLTVINFGWGLFYGSLISILILIGMLVWAMAHIV